MTTDKLSVIERNKIIAVFMGGKQVGKIKGSPYTIWEVEIWGQLHRDIHDYLFQYHSSWDWLMPVVEKIENKLKWKYEVEIGNNVYHPDIMYRCTIHDAGNATYLEFESKTKIEAVWLAVVEFIKWHNNQNK